MYKFFGIFILSLFFISCSSELDFNQSKDLKLKQTFVANLVSFDIPANQFVSNLLFRDETNFDVFNNVDFRNNLNRADLSFEFANTISRSYAVSVNFLDIKGENLFSISVEIPSNSGSLKPIIKNKIFKDADLDILKQTKKLSFEIQMKPGGVPLTVSSLGSLKMRSSAIIYIVAQ